MGPALWPFLGSSLLFLGSLAASGVALYGVVKSNATNRLAITAADNRATVDRAEGRDRDFRAWQRDTFLQISTEVVEAALNAEDDYRRLAHSLTPPQMDSADSIEQAGRRIGLGVLRLNIIGAHGAADHCRAIRAVVNAQGLIGATIDLNANFRRSLDPQDASDPEFRRALAESQARFDQLLGQISQVRGAFGAVVEAELRWITMAERPEQLQNPSGSTGDDLTDRRSRRAAVP